MRKLTEILTVDRVKAAYGRTGLKPCQGSYYTDAAGNNIKAVAEIPSCACPIGAVLYDEGITDANLLGFGPDETAAHLLRCSPTEVSYFVNAVDGEPMPETRIGDGVRPLNPDWVAAYELGLRVREAAGL